MGKDPVRRKRSSPSPASPTPRASSCASPKSSHSDGFSARLPLPGESIALSVNTVSHATKEAHETNAAALDKGIASLDSYLQLLRDSSVSSKVQASPQSLDNRSLANNNSRDFSSEKVLSVMSDVIDECSRPSLEYVLGILGAEAVPKGLQERQRNLGAQAFFCSLRNRLRRRKSPHPAEVTVKSRNPTKEKLVPACARGISMSEMRDGPSVEGVLKDPSKSDAQNSTGSNMKTQPMQQPPLAITSNKTKVVSGLNPEKPSTPLSQVLEKSSHMGNQENALTIRAPPSGESKDSKHVGHPSEGLIATASRSATDKVRGCVSRTATGGPSKIPIISEQNNVPTSLGENMNQAVGNALKPFGKTDVQRKEPPQGQRRRRMISSLQSSQVEASDHGFQPEQQVRQSRGNVFQIGQPDDKYVKPDVGKISESGRADSECLSFKNLVTSRDEAESNSHGDKSGEVLIASQTTRSDPKETHARTEPSAQGKISEWCSTRPLGHAGQVSKQLYPDVDGNQKCGRSDIGIAHGMSDLEKGSHIGRNKEESTSKGFPCSRNRVKKSVESVSLKSLSKLTSTNSLVNSLGDCRSSQEKASMGSLALSSPNLKVKPGIVKKTPRPVVKTTDSKTSTVKNMIPKVSPFPEDFGKVGPEAFEGVKHCPDKNDTRSDTVNDNHSHIENRTDGLSVKKRESVGATNPYRSISDVAPTYFKPCRDASESNFATKGRRSPQESRHLLTLPDTITDVEPRTFTSVHKGSGTEGSARKVVSKDAITDSAIIESTAQSERKHIARENDGQYAMSTGAPDEIDGKSIARTSPHSSIPGLDSTQNIYSHPSSKSKTGSHIAVYSPLVTMTSQPTAMLPRHSNEKGSDHEQVGHPLPTTNPGSDVGQGKKDTHLSNEKPPARVDRSANNFAVADIQKTPAKTRGRVDLPKCPVPDTQPSKAPKSSWKDKSTMSSDAAQSGPVSGRRRVSKFGDAPEVRGEESNRASGSTSLTHVNETAASRANQKALESKPDLMMAVTKTGEPRTSPAPCSIDTKMFDESKRSLQTIGLLRHHPNQTSRLTGTAENSSINAGLNVSDPGPRETNPSVPICGSRSGNVSDKLARSDGNLKKENVSKSCIAKSLEVVKSSITKSVLSPINDDTEKQTGKFVKQLSSFDPKREGKSEKAGQDRNIKPFIPRERLHLRTDRSPLSEKLKLRKSVTAGNLALESKIAVPDVKQRTEMDSSLDLRTSTTKKSDKLRQEKRGPASGRSSEFLRTNDPHGDASREDVRKTFNANISSKRVGGFTTKTDSFDETLRRRSVGHNLKHARKTREIDQVASYDSSSHAPEASGRSKNLSSEIVKLGGKMDSKLSEKAFQGAPQSKTAKDEFPNAKLPDSEIMSKRPNVESNDSPDVRPNAETEALIPPVARRGEMLKPRGSSKPGNHNIGSRTKTATETSGKSNTTVKHTESAVVKETSNLRTLAKEHESKDGAIQDKEGSTAKGEQSDVLASNGIEVHELEDIFGEDDTSSKDSELNPIGKMTLRKSELETGPGVSNADSKRVDEGIVKDGETREHDRKMGPLNDDNETKVTNVARRGTARRGRSGSKAAGEDRPLGTRRLRRESTNLRDAWTQVMPGDVLFDGDELMQECVAVWTKVNQAKISIPFREPVQAKDAPHYFDIVREPMDLSTVRRHLEEKKIDNPRKFYKQMMRICHNAMLYNDVESDIYGLALELCLLIRKSTRPLVRKWMTRRQSEDGGEVSGSSLSSWSGGENNDRDDGPEEVAADKAGVSSKTVARTPAVDGDADRISRKRKPKLVLEDDSEQKDLEDDDEDDDRSKTGSGRRGGRVSAKNRRGGAERWGGRGRGGKRREGREDVVVIVGRVRGGGRGGRRGGRGLRRGGSAVTTSEGEGRGNRKGQKRGRAESSERRTGGDDKSVVQTSKRRRITSKRKRDAEDG